MVFHIDILFNFIDLKFPIFPLIRVPLNRVAGKIYSIPAQRRQFELDNWIKNGLIYKYKLLTLNQ